MFNLNHDLHIKSLKFLATVGTGVFAGVALSANVVEMPASKGLELKAALAHWRETFVRARPLQSALSLVSGLCSLTVGFLTEDPLWYAGGCVMLGLWPYTYLAIRPINHKLLDFKVRP